ncbi:MAG TPA: AAA family ATPase [Candidatus Paceibacterota bacterium]|nr:AAA family ATPase [Candidatus Paceibacterota bacterium]
MQWSAIGHEDVKRYLERLVMTGRFGHAYLFTGPEGIGKRMVAEDVARLLIPQGDELDITRLSPERDEDGRLHDIPIGAVRDMKRWVVLRPVGFKVVIIDDADRLGGEAANTLLKVLEEPPLYAKFLLITGRLGAVLPTIASRCERVDFRPLDEAQMKTALAGLKLDADDRALLAAVAAGRPGMALKLLQNGEVPDVARHIAGLEKALKGGITERLVYAKEVADDERAPEIASWWLAWVHTHLAERPALAPVARGIQELVSVLGEPQFNRRLAVEHFLLSVD